MTCVSTPRVQIASPVFAVRSIGVAANHIGLSSRKPGFKSPMEHSGITTQTWVEILLGSTNNMVVTEEECIDSLERAKEELGHTPSKPEYESLGFQPAASTIMRKFGGWNEAKREAGLETLTKGSRTNKEIDPKPENVTIPEGKTWEGLNARQRWYYKNKEYEIQRTKERRKGIKQWYLDIKAELGCSQCEESHPACIDFHHIGEKDEGISRMVARGVSKERVLEEMEQCIPLCANCHRKEHYDGA